VYKLLFLLLISLSSLTLAGCQPVTVQRSEGAMPLPVTVRVDDVGYWLEEWQRIIVLPTEQLQAVLQTREKEFTAAHTARTRLRLALLLTAGPASVRDHAKALNLLKHMDVAKADSSEKALAALLEQMIAEQQWSGDKITEQRVLLKESEDRIGELERQLQELKNIEHTIQQRN
jgi:hypothetical protein